MPYASSQQQGYAQDENREPAKASEQNLESAVLSADMREWFHDVGAPKDKYAFSVQTEIPEEDVAYEEEEVPTVYGCSGHEQKEEKSPDTVSEPADPFVKPAPVIVEPSPECREAESPSVVRDASDVKGADEEQGAAVSSVAPFDQTSPNTFTDGDALPSETTNSNPALVSDAAGVPKKPGQKRRLSFSDETGVSDEIAFPERKRLSISVDTHAAEASPWDGSGRRSITAGAVSAFGEHEGLQQPTSLNIVIPEEEYSRRRGELSGTTESKKSLETDDEEELPFNENEKQSFPTRNIEEIQHTASASTGSLDQYNAPLEGSSPRSAPKDAAEDAGETRSPRNEDNKMERPDNADASLPGEKFEGRKSSFSSSTATLGPSNEQSTIPCDNATAVPGEAEGKTDAALRTIESSFAQRNHMGLPVGFEDTFPDAADATSAGGSGASHSSVTVGYSHRPQSDGSGAPGAEDNSDDLELLKARVLGPKARIEKPGTEVQMGPSDTFSQSGPHGTDSLFLSDPLQSGNADVAYAAAIALKDTDLHVTSLSAAVIDGATGVAEEFNVPYTEQKVVVESEASSSQRPLLPQCKTAPGDEAQTQDVGQTIEGIVQQASDAATSRPRASDEAHGASTSNEEDECVPLSPEDADKQGEDDDVIAPGDVPEDDVRSPDAVSRCEELRFSNFRTVVEYMANPSVGSDTNIVYDSFVPPESRVIDALDSVYHDTEFTVRAVDDYDISGIMYDCWSKEVTSVAPTLKTFWTYSPHSFLLCVDEEGTHCGIISALVFDNEQAFCAPNHVKGEFLSEGVRRRLWDALLRVLRGKNAFALVPAEQVHAYHRHLGFYTSARGLALHGRLSPSTDLAPFARAQLPDGVQIMKFKKQMFKALLAFDESTFGFGRRRFWKLTLREGPISFRLALADEGTRVCGYAGLQNDVYGVPVLRWLVADDGAVAQQLLYNLLSGSLRFRQRGAWMAIYARSHASEALLKHTDTSHFEPCMLVFNRREPFLQYKNISVLTYI